MGRHRVMVTASRKWTDRAAIHRDLRMEDAVHRGEDITLVVGDCEGGDTIATAFAREVLGWTVEVHRADWNTHGKSAGPRRNQAMVETKPAVCYAYPLPSSRGTWDAVRRAQRAGIPTHVRPAEAA